MKDPNPQLFDYLNDSVNILDAIDPSQVTEQYIRQLWLDDDMMLEELTKIIEGNWVEVSKTESTWVPPQIYFYLRHAKIKMANKSGKSFSTGRPIKRTLDAQLNLDYLQVRGFSGFEFDQEHHCNLAYQNQPTDPSGRNFIPVFDYLRLKHRYSKGRALYENDATDLFLISGRGWGKSKVLAGMLGVHYLITRGATSMEEYYDGIGSMSIISHENKDVAGWDLDFHTTLNNLVDGGIDAHGDILGQDHAGKLIKSPFTTDTLGSLNFKDPIQYGHIVNQGGKPKLTKSIGDLSGRSTSRSKSALNGLRSGLTFFDEVGKALMLEVIRGNLLDVLEPMGMKLGPILWGGTSIDGNAETMAVLRKMYFSPKDFNIGRAIFVPQAAVQIKYYNERGILDIQKAVAEIDNQYVGIKGKELIMKRINRPRKVEDCFLGGTDKNPHNVEKVEKQINNLLDPDTDSYIMPRHGLMYKDANNDVGFEEDPDAIPLSWDITNGTHGGCVTIFESPPLRKNHGIKDLIVMSFDPYAKSKAPQSNSVGSFFVYMRAVPGINSVPRLLAEGHIRLDDIYDTFDQVLWIAEWYGVEGNLLYENNFDDFEKYAKKNKQLHRLALTPDLSTGLYKSEDSYGIRTDNDKIKDKMMENAVLGMSKKINGTKDFYDYCPSIFYLQQMLNWHKDGNFDSISSGMVLWTYLAFLEVMEDTRMEARQNNANFENQVSSFIFASNKSMGKSAISRSYGARRGRTNITDN